MYVHMYLFIPTYIYKNVHAYMHTYIHTYIHKYIKQTSSSGPWPRKVELTCLHSKKPNYHESLHIAMKPYCIDIY